ncbi:NYN domain-containing protein [Alkalihalobacillus sp. MEB130]|uniref:NYN domain-containing protein n=1 Tax=Alkalihalobacillus sp. MEB130 TaxID=2976704 RepID=UPI0028DFA4FE|nr:NYN domain-containing protein [Alkalihalobacillus sp. MEB130]MDT8862309.1 NYN domain-containing protein [Alkalihalobacillus sp. MEB130]
MKDILLVDGYNMIGAWPELRELKDKDLGLARDRLVEMLAEYQAYTGFKVKVIFDAHMVEGIGKKYKDHRIDVLYTRKNETADERIEKLVHELKRIDTTIHVATSDMAEQSMIFGSGALRKSARELLLEMETTEKGIDIEVQKTQKKKNSTKIPLSDEIAEIFEKWRRQR